MTQVIADLLETQSLRDQMCGAGMTQCVRATMLYLDSQRLEFVVDWAEQGRRGQRALRRFSPEEYLRVRTVRSHGADRAGRRSGHRWQQRIDLRTPTRQTQNAKRSTV